MNLETELRERLTSAATGADRWDDDWAAADAVIDRRRVEKRHRVVGGALATVCAVLIGVLVPTVGSGLFADSSAPPADGVTTTGPWDRPTRGSLAHDEAFLSALRAEDWPDVPQPTSRRVVFAGDVDGHRWALVAGEVGGALQGLWLVGDAGAAPGGLSPASTVPLTGDGVATAGLRAPDGVWQLVLAQPGDQVLAATGLTVAADGTVSRDFAPLTMRSGVGIAALPVSPGSNSLAYRVQRRGVLVASGTASGYLDLDVGAASEVEADDVAGQTPSRGGQVRSVVAVDSAVQSVLGPTGLTAEQAHAQLLWAGSIGTVDGVDAQGVIVSFTMPSGAVLTSVAWDVPDATPARVDDPRQPGGGPCGTAIQPAGTSAADAVVAAECLVGSDPVQRRLVVSAPRGVTQVQLETGAGLGAPRPLPGSGAVDDPGAVSAVTVSGPGVGPRSARLGTTGTYDPLYHLGD